MTEQEYTRPDPVVLAELVKDLGRLHVELGLQLDRRDPLSVDQSVASTGVHSAPPANTVVMSARAEIEHFATVRLTELRSAGKWRIHPSHSTLQGRLDAIANRVGFWIATPEDDRPPIWFGQQVDEIHARCSRVAYPPAVRAIPIGQCFEPDCDGALRIALPDNEAARDRTERERKKLFATSRPMAVCEVDPRHWYDAGLIWGEEFMEALS